MNSLPKSPKRQADREEKETRSINPDMFSKSSTVPDAEYRWMRANLPYGLWNCADGTQVLFNRNYQPIWAKPPGAPARRVEPSSWVPWVQERFLFKDDTAPWLGRNHDTLAKLCEVLNAFVQGVQ